MKTIIRNDDNLKESDMTEVATRVKVLLINSKQELLLGYPKNNYQFPGGHVEEGETLLDTVKREVREETGIELEIEDITPFAEAFGYYKDYPEVGKNKKTEIYYYAIKTDELPNLENTSYTEREKENHFILKQVPLENIEEEFENNIKQYGDDRGIQTEMLEIIKVYKNENTILK
ncbi:MAG: NUDIX hydrolase [Bacilli bacterium]|nr:NUDIX hydrolase [Bacilli bacterium]